jgi:hypothetical protein
VLSDCGAAQDVFRPAESACVAIQDFEQLIFSFWSEFRVELELTLVNFWWWF